MAKARARPFGTSPGVPLGLILVSFVDDGFRAAEMALEFVANLKPSARARLLAPYKTRRKPGRPVKYDPSLFRILLTAVEEAKLQLRREGNADPSDREAIERLETWCMESSQAEGDHDSAKWFRSEISREGRKPKVKMYSSMRKRLSEARAFRKS